jgi:hypothetical protein
MCYSGDLVIRQTFLSFILLSRSGTNRSFVVLLLVLEMGKAFALGVMLKVRPSQTLSNVRASEGACDSFSGHQARSR